MPEAMERKLKAMARKKGMKGERADKYVFGTMNKKGMLSPRKKQSTINRIKREGLSKNYSE